MSLWRAETTVPRILFSSPCGPYPKAPVEKDPVDFFYYRNTLGQGIFRLRSFQSWYSLHFLAQNLPVPSVVLENPSMQQFQREVIRGDFQAVAIGFTVITMAPVLAMVLWLKQTHPGIDVILGGYGTAVFKDADATAALLQARAERICFGEGVEFMRRYLKERWGIRQDMPLRQDFLPMEHCFFRTSIPIFKQLVFLGSLGCTFGCPFCATSSQFDRRRIPIASGRELFDLILGQARRHPKVQSAIIYDEDFLIDRRRVVEFMRMMDSCRELQDRPLLLTVFASVRSLRQYSIVELIRCGIGTIYIGVESFEEEILQREGLRKRDGDIRKWFDELHQNGISTLGSLIVGWDGQSRERIQQETDRFVSLNPTFYQVVPLHPVPGTALWKRLKAQGRFVQGYAFANDSIGHYSFTLRDVAPEEALDCVAGAYRGLVAEGGPWPFRLAENLLRGYRHLSSEAHPVLRARALAYWKMCKPLLPLAIVSRAFFRGSGFKKRWSILMRQTWREHSVVFIGSCLVAIIACPFLMGIYGVANMLYWIRPRGDQPRFIRVNAS
jgi:haloalkane dehalogenase